MKTTDILNDFARRLRFFRDQRGLSQAALGLLVGKKSTTVSTWERGESEPDREEIAIIAQHLGVSPQHLAYGIVGGVPTDSPEVLPPPVKSAAEVKCEENEGSYGTADMLTKDAQRRFEELIQAAKNDPVRLGWIIEQMKEHLSAPRNWQTNEELNRIAHERVRREIEDNPREYPELARQKERIPESA